MSPRESSPRLLAAEREYQRLLAEKDEVDTALMDIKAQIDQAKLRLNTKGEYSDPAWWARVNYALRAKGRESQAIQRELAELRSRIKKLRNAELETCFVEVARAQLDDQTFARLWVAARTLSDSRANAANDTGAQRERDTG